MKLYPLSILAVFCSPALAATSSLQVSSVIQEVVGTSSTVTGSGSKDNTNTWTLSTTARFLMTGTDASGQTTTVGMEIQPVAYSGGISPNTDSLMIARTANSQTLTDAGTVSVYVSPSGTGIWSLDLAFRFFDPSFSTAVNSPIWLTSLDLDFGQKMYLFESDIDSYTLETGSAVGVGKVDDAYRFTGAGDAVYNDADHAVSVQTKPDSEFRVRLEHSGVALFMFEFRNPSQNVTFENPVTETIPEPSAAAMVGAVGVLALLRRRRP